MIKVEYLSDNMEKDSSEFVCLLTENQNAIYAYILTLISDRSRARDLLQETNLTLWKKAADFEEGTNFLAWGRKVAYFHVLAFRRKMARDRLVFDDDVLDYLAERQDERDDEVSLKAEALRICLQKLPRAQRELVQARYRPGGSVKVMAEEMNRSVGSISQTLYRIRHALMTCIEKTVAQNKQSESQT